MGMSSMAGFNKKYYFLLALLFVMAVFLPVNYLLVLNFDDVEVLARIQGGFSNIQWDKLFFKNSLTRYYRPLLTVLCYLDYAIWGSALSAWHLTNYMIHILNAVLVYLIACSWFKSDDNFRLWAVMAMLFFALNPLTCESVAWISGRSDLAGTFFALIAVWAYYFKSNARFVIVPAAVLAGLLCKENALSVIPIIVLLEGFHRYREGSTVSRIAKGCLLWGCLVLIPLMIYLFLRTNGFEHNTYVHAKAVAPMVSKKYAVDTAYVKIILNLAPVSAFYIKKLFIPFPLNFAISKINTMVYSFLFLGIAGINVYCLIKRKWALPFFFALVFISFFPALIVAMGGVAWMSMAERYLYLSLSVTAISFTSFFVHCYRRQMINTRVLIAILVPVFLILSASSVLRQFDFKNDKTIWTHTVERNPDNQNVLFMYGAAVDGIEGQRAYHKALENPKLFDFRDKTHFNIAFYEIRQGNQWAAVNHIEKALAIKSSYRNYVLASTILLNFGNMDGNVLEKKHMYKAVHYLEKARAKKESVFILNNLAMQLAFLGDVDQAEKIYRKIIEKYPRSRFADYARNYLAKNKP